MATETTRVLQAYAIVRARDWVLPMYNRDNYMMVPLIDMLNYGQARGRGGDRRVRSRCDCAT